MFLDEPRLGNHPSTHADARLTEKAMGKTSTYNKIAEFISARKYFLFT